MQLLLTSAGFTNQTLAKALLALTEKPFSKLNLAFVPTAANVEEGDKGWVIDDLVNCKRLGFASIDIVDISALPSTTCKRRMEEADVLLFGGGNTFHLMYWIKKVGLDKLLQTLLSKRVYVGISAGSMVATPRLALSQSQELYYEDMKEKPESEEGLGFVNFQVRPHLNSPLFPKVRVEYLEQLAKEIKEAIYAIDDQTAIQVEDDKISVVSEGQWKRFN